MFYHYMIKRKKRTLDKTKFGNNSNWLNRSTSVVTYLKRSCPLSKVSWIMLQVLGYHLIFTNNSVQQCVLCPPLTAGLTSLADESSCSRGWQHLSLQILATEWLSNTALSPVSQDNPIFVEEGRFRWWSETSSQGNFFYLVKDKREICLGLNLLVYLTERIFWEFYPERKKQISGKYP